MKTIYGILLIIFAIGFWISALSFTYKWVPIMYLEDPVFTIIGDTEDSQLYGAKKVVKKIDEPYRGQDTCNYDTTNYKLIWIKGYYENGDSWQGYIRVYGHKNIQHE